MATHPILRNSARRASVLAAPLLSVLVKALFGFLRMLGPDRAGHLGAWVLRTVAPLIPANRTAIDNIRAAFPDWSDADRERVRRESWENLGRTVCEYPFLQELMDFDYDHPDRPSRTEVQGIDQFVALVESGKPAIIFSAHLANWEMPAVAAARYGLDTTVVFRPPNNVAAARAVEVFRAGAMGKLLPSGPGAAAGMMSTLEKGGVLGMLADQHLARGVPVEFIGRPALANPVLAKLARKYECPVHGARAIRLPGGRFRLELTPALELPRDDQGHIDVEGATALIARVIEGWVRENPGQWLWQHRRWRPIQGRHDPLRYRG
ncbi:MAG: lipid A biosynthesis lauroyl acyltransferase [Beijerinckiaceae bacterium]